jgi:hypothetical protein
MDKDNTSTAESGQKNNSAIVIPQFIDLNNVDNPSYLQQLLDIEHDLKTRKSGTISFSKAILKQNGRDIIFPNTINVIQGQAGVHKSRLAQVICSAFLKKEECMHTHLGFERQAEIPVIIYIDTERNLKDQLPYALQTIQINAGYNKSDHPEHFYHTSLLTVVREERFEALDEYLRYRRSNTDKHLFIVLDVTTDCISDFNKAEKSMELIDLMNRAINEHNATFLCIIHENPKSDKARGHLGTEMMNKASTHMQVGYEKDDKQKDTELISVKYLKCRNTERHAPLYLKYCNVEKGLVLADEKEISESINARTQKADLVSVIEHLEIHLGDGSEISRRELLDIFNAAFSAKDRTSEKRLMEVIEAKTSICDNTGANCILTKFRKSKEIFYKLIKQP